MYLPMITDITIKMSLPKERYPDPKKFDEKLYNNLTFLPNNVTLDIHFIQKHINPQVRISYLLKQV